MLEGLKTSSKPKVIIFLIVKYLIHFVAAVQLQGDRAELNSGRYFLEKNKNYITGFLQGISGLL